MSARFTGYPIRLEDRKWLQRKATPFYGAVRGQYTAPISLNARQWMRTENQGSVGSCAGMAKSTTDEYLHYVATGGKVIQFNGMYAYLRAQGIDGLLGRDRGSTIKGNVEAGYRFGACPIDWGGDGSDDYPYRGAYTTSVPAEADKHAALYKIRSHSWISTLNEWDAYLKSGQGPLIVGAEWGYWGPDRNGYCRHFQGGGGGHAWAVLDWDDSDEDGIYWMLNSHGANWGLNGWAKLTKGFVTQMLSRNYTSVAGVSDLTTPEPRSLDWVKDGYL